MNRRNQANVPSETLIEWSGEVLVVDDNEGIRKMVRFALEDAGYTVLEASDGVEALNCVRTHTKRLVVLLDLNLPRLDGWGLLSAVVQTPLARRHRYLLVTAEGDTLPPAFVRLLCQLHVPIIAKPYTINRLLEAVAERPTLGRVHEGYAAAGTA